MKESINHLRAFVAFLVPSPTSTSSTLTTWETIIDIIWSSNISNKIITTRSISKCVEIRN